MAGEPARGGDLEAIPSGLFELIVLPLPLRGLDGSPVRAVGRISG
ncbi:MAG: hypothetical protein ACP5XB_05180 [Isosphaeraceae bacterium]